MFGSCRQVMTGETRIHKMKKCFLFAALILAGFCGQAQAQYYYYPQPYYYYRGPIAYDANAYLRETMYNTHRFYNLGSAEAYLRQGMANTHYFYGF